ncbi:hypothetical protein BSL78_13332 [Apostichopus japonicus]|uniref:TIR domain-containing protein n=1 Tax=Stichopus japonicus TaxID=307972 RepID=A0A2G8KP37_STIJA|nr:hypothetical protein BSL78_13332 [Apostichopus japonicus]
MEDDRARLEEDFAKTLQDLSEELTSSDIRKLTNLYPKISNKEADKIRKDDDPADCFLRKIKGWELSETNVDGLIKSLQYIQLIKAAGILKRYKSRNTNLINKEIERREHEKQLVASTASSVPAKSPTSQKGDRTDVKDKVFISFSSKIEEKVTELVRRIDSLVGYGSCWIYTTRNKPGESVPQEIVDAIHKADIMLCMINQDYIDSEPCEEEFLLAKKLKKQIILLHMEKGLQPYKKKNGHNSPMQLATADQLYARMYIEKHEEEFQKVIAKIKECLSGKDANASSFRLFKVDLADHLNVAMVQRLSILLGLKPGEIDSIKRSKTLGLEMVNLLENRRVITPTDITDLLDMLQELKLPGLAARMQQSFQAKTSQGKKHQDLYLEGKTLVAPGSPSTSGSQKRKCSHDGDDSEVKVTRKE